MSEGKGLTRAQRLTLLRWLKNDAIDTAELRDIMGEPTERTRGEIATERVRLGKALGKAHTVVTFMWQAFNECYTAEDITERAERIPTTDRPTFAELWGLVAPSRGREHHTGELRGILGLIIKSL